MERAKKLIKEAESLMGVCTPESEERIKAIVAELKKTDSPEQRRLVSEMTRRQMAVVEQNIKEIEQEVLRDKMSDDLYKLIPWSYIAEKYFGKSLSWLTQRVNGYSVRGHVYTLNAEQKEILNRALADIGTVIGSYRFA